MSRQPERLHRWEVRLCDVFFPPPFRVAFACCPPPPSPFYFPPCLPILTGNRWHWQSLSFKILAHPLFSLFLFASFFPFTCTLYAGRFCPFREPCFFFFSCPRYQEDPNDHDLLFPFSHSDGICPSRPCPFPPQPFGPESGGSRSGFPFLSTPSREARPFFFGS